jgi:hypothetical protein
MVAHNQAVRVRAIELHRQGTKMTQIARQLQVSYDSIRTWVRRHGAEGEKGLASRYGRCGRRVDGQRERIRQRALALKKEERDWGAPFILLHLADEFPGAALPGARSLQRWFRAGGLQPARTRLPRARAGWAGAAFERVQVDAKERLSTADGRPCCYLNFTDEYTGSELDAFVFPLCPHQRGARPAGL